MAVADTHELSSVQFDDIAEDPSPAYSEEGDIPLYDGKSADGFAIYQDLLPEYEDIDAEAYSSIEHTGPSSAIQQYIDLMNNYDNKAAVLDAEGEAHDSNEEARVPEYKADDLRAVARIDVEQLLENYDEQIAERMQAYNTDPEDGWAPLLESDTHGKDAYDIEIDESSKTEDTQQYSTTVDDGFYERLLEDGPEVYGRYLEDENGVGYLEFAEVSTDTEDLPVVEHEMADGLFGFVNPTEDHPVAHVNKALYKIDKEPTRRHESSRSTGHPSDWAANELQIRYKNGDIDVQNTLSFQANQVARLGDSAGHIPYSTDSFGVYGPKTPETPMSANSADPNYVEA